MKEFSKALKSFIKDFPDVWEAHEKTGDKIHKAGPLDKKTAHLVQLGIAIAGKSQGAVKSHVSQAKSAGATREEIYHAILLAMNPAGFPSTIMAYSWAKEVLDKIEDGS